MASQILLYLACYPVSAIAAPNPIKFPLAWVTFEAMYPKKTIGSLVLQVAGKGDKPKYAMAALRAISGSLLAKSFEYPKGILKRFITSFPTTNIKPFRPRYLHGTFYTISKTLPRYPDMPLIPS